MGQDGRLGVVRASELLLRSFPHDAREGNTERLVDGREGVSSCRKPLRQILPHADSLGALTRAHEHGYHRITELPQVKPAPKATSRRSEPDFTRPSAMA